jgi:putative ABC transport system permease protein
VCSAILERCRSIVNHSFFRYPKSMFYIAIKMLIGDRGKFLGILLGISFAAIIMTQQPGIFLGIMTRAFSFISDIGIADIWVTDPMLKFIDDGKGMPSTMLYRVASIPGVEWAKPLYKGAIQARMADGNFQTCNVIGIDDATMVGGPLRMVSGSVADLRQADGIIVNEEGANDKLARRAYPGGPKIPLKIGDVIAINDNRAKIVGIAKTTRTFMSQPIVFTTYTRALTFSPPQRDFLTFVLVKAKKGEDIQKLKQRIKAETKMGVFDREEFKDLTVDYYMKYTAIPINFGFSVLLGFLVGAIIAAQTFYSFTLENLKYFGVLKAMGANNKTLLKMILLQASTVGILGYGLGLGGTFLFSMYVGDAGVLAFRFPWQLLVFSFCGIVIITALSALLSIIKVVKLEAAIVFKG